MQSLWGGVVSVPPISLGAARGGAKLTLVLAGMLR